MVPRLRAISQSRRTTFFNRYDLQYLNDAVGLIVEQLGVFVDYEQLYVRQLAYLANLAVKRRADKAKGVSP